MMSNSEARKRQAERAAGELVADVDTLAVAIRRHSYMTPRDLAEALVAAGFGRIDAARREALLSAADRMPAFHDRDVPEWAITSACRWLRDRAHQIGRTS